MTYVKCEQLRRRSAYASAPSDQRLFVHCLASIQPLVSMYEIASLYLAFVAAKAGLNLTWSQTTKTRFLMTGLNFLHNQHWQIL